MHDLIVFKGVVLILGNSESLIRLNEAQANLVESKSRWEIRNHSYLAPHLCSEYINIIVFLAYTVNKSTLNSALVLLGRHIIFVPFPPSSLKEMKMAFLNIIELAGSCSIQCYFPFVHAFFPLCCHPFKFPLYPIHMFTFSSVSCSSYQSD